VTITNDGATILSQLEVEHPAARVLVQLSEMQDKEVGDGTTSVVILASELLKRAHELVKNGIHPTSVMAGYRMAMKARTPLPLTPYPLPPTPYPLPPTPYPLPYP
jgi:T-complex protein 1 subunit alpha